MSHPGRRESQDAANWARGREGARRYGPRFSGSNEWCGGREGEGSDGRETGTPPGADIPQALHPPDRRTAPRSSPATLSPAAIRGGNRDGSVPHRSLCLLANGTLNSCRPHSDTPLDASAVAGSSIHGAAVGRIPCFRRFLRGRGIPHGRPPLGYGAIGAGFLFGAWMTIWAVVMRRRDLRAAGPHGVPDGVGISRALRTGEPPPEQTMDQAILGLIERRRRQLQWSSKVSPWIFGALIVMSALVVAVQHDASSVVSQRTGSVSLRHHNVAVGDGDVQGH